LQVLATDGINTGTDIIKAPFPKNAGGKVPGAGGNTIEQALDVNGNGLLDDEEIKIAVRLWIQGQPVPGTGQTIDDAKIRQLIQLWINGGPVVAQSQAQASGLPAVLSLNQTSVADEGGQFVLNTTGQGIRRVQLQVFGLEGRRLLDETNVGSRLRFELVDDAGHRWANGVYLYVVTVYGDHGSALRSELHKFVVLR